MPKAKELKDEIIIAALLEARNVRAASVICGVSATAIYRRLKNPEFNKKYTRASRELLKSHTAALQSHIGDAIATLAEIMNDKENAPQVRTNAAAELLRNGLKFTETVDLLSEIEELESM